jgi:hypothetical protein
MHCPSPLQDWGSELFEALRAAGGKAYSNYAVGYNNVKVRQGLKPQFVDRQQAPAGANTFDSNPSPALLSYH